MPRTRAITAGSITAVLMAGALALATTTGLVGGARPGTGTTTDPWPTTTVPAEVTTPLQPATAGPDQDVVRAQPHQSDEHQTVGEEEWDDDD